METNGTRDAHSARDALAAVGATRSEVADRLVTPWWYHPILGVLVAQMVLVIGWVEESAWRVVSSVVLIAGAAVLIATYTRLTGMAATRPTGARSTACFWALVVVIALPILRVTTSRIDPAEATVWAVVALLGTVVLGRLYDAAYRADLRQERSR